MACQYCEDDSGIFDLHCEKCRQRIAMRQPCKIMRKQLVEEVERQFGFVADYTQEPHCGCDTVCKKKQRIKKNYE
jgi:hypothetical protein